MYTTYYFLWYATLDTDSLYIEGEIHRENVDPHMVYSSNKTLCATLIYSDTSEY